MKPDLVLALADRDPQFVFDGSSAWNVSAARGFMAATNLTRSDLIEASTALDASLAPAPRQWIGDRLTVLASMFSVGRNAPDVGSVTIWLVEASAMLSDLPHDILAGSIDEAVKTRTHGFMPSIGEIRQTAEPLLARRLEQVARLNILLKSMDEWGTEAVAS